MPAQSLAVFRILFGLVGAWSALRILAFGWVDSLYADPPRHFSYPGLGWVPAPDRGGMRLLLGLAVVAGGMVAAGWCYRAAMAVFWLAFTWIEAIDVTTYLNHYWFMTAVGAVMVVAPMAATWSIDARRRRRRGGPATVAVAWVWLFRAQVAAVYVFAGLAKLQPTWLVEGRPLRLWLPVHADIALVGPWLATPGAALLLSWAGALFDCSIVPLLLWRRTRLAAWGLVVAFHTVTGLLFPIGVFPVLMVGGTLVFFPPDWPSRLARRFGARWEWVAGSGARPPTVAAPLPRWVRVAMVLVVLLHLAVPLRHLAYPGDARWTGEAYRFSWNVLLNEKAGSVDFRLTDRATGRTWRDGAADLYTPLQLRVMATEPELIRQAAHALAEEAAARGVVAEVRVDAFLSLNGQPVRRLIDPTVDLAAEPARLTPQPWILPAEG